MSVIFQCSDGIVICHENYLKKAYVDILKGDRLIKLTPHEHLFCVKTPYMKNEEAMKRVSVSSDLSNLFSQKRKFSEISSDDATKDEMANIMEVHEKILREAKRLGFLGSNPSCNDICNNNSEARELSAKFLRESSGWQLPLFNGENSTDTALLKTVGSQSFIFPPRCKFFCHDIRDMKNNLDSLGKFDLILLDPPWWNKYIRRKKAKCLAEGYQMMRNESFGEVPLGELLVPGGLVAVWCTNSKTHLKYLRENLFPLWGIKQISQWFWLKITQSGHPVCSFSPPPGKQPYERLVFATRPEEVELYPRPENGKVFMSVPSAIHSHKPPISEMMKQYIPREPRCFEIFARYLLPNWTSWGLEVIKLQHVSLFYEDPSS